MSSLVGELTRTRFGGADEQLQSCLARRHVISVRVSDAVEAHGVLEPIGNMYAHGFNILIPKGVPATRLRFTLAHEVCHTFFYEYVPELKFVPHEPDVKEERLCDFGAAELLMPAAPVKQTAAGMTICMQSLCALAVDFAVSLTSMFIRLRTLRLWDCVLSEWHQMVNGDFVLANMYGGKRLPWQWDDPTILRDAWHSRCAVRGSTFLRYDSTAGNRYYYPARFEVQRIGNRLMALWGPSVKEPAVDTPLFRTA